MNGVIYKMTKELYDSIRYPLFSRKGQKQNRKPMTDAEVLEYVNRTFGIKDKIVKIDIM